MPFVGKKASPKKKRITPEERKKQLTILNSQLSAIENSILTPTAESTSSLDSDEDSESDLSESSDFLGSIAINHSTPKSGPQPRFGDKCPKPQAAPRCINVKCREERAVKDKMIADLKSEVTRLQEELRK